MKIAYPVRFNEAEEGGFWAEGVGPLKGVFTEGETLAEVRNNAREAITLFLEVLLDEGKPIPRPEPAAEGAELIAPFPDVMAPILLRWAREEEGLTQGQLATKLGITQQAVQKLERSGANPSIKTLVKVARALGRELDIAI